MKSKKFIKLIYYFFAFLGLILFLGIYMQGLGADEPFTISLIKHSYNQVIYLDLFDVHPPLYYLLLKAFLDVVTFWTKSILIKIIFARILSLIFFVISFYFLLKILNMLQIKVNKIVLLIFFFAFPQISKYSLSIRMYQLSAMLIVLEIYGLLYFKRNGSLGLVISTIAIAFSFYINYFTAMFAGTMLVIELASYLINKEYKKSLYILFSGIVDLLLFIPGYFFLYHQLIHVSSSNYSNYVNVGYFGRNIYTQILSAFTGEAVNGFFSVIICIMLLFIGITVTIMSYKYNRFVYAVICKLYITMIVGLVPAVFLSMVKHPMIMGRYGHPIFFSLYFFIIASFLNTIKYLNKSFCLKLFISVLCIILFLMDMKGIKDIIYLDKVNYDYVRIYSQFNKDRTNTIHVNGFKALYCSTYLNNRHKKINSTSLPVKSTLASNNMKLMLNIFNNIKYKN